MKKTTNGFTIVELIVIITIIGILASIGIVSLYQVQIGARNSQRSSNVKSISEALEKYYSNNGEYPLCSVMSTEPASSVTSSTLKGLDPAVLTAPKESAGSNSIGCTALADEGSDDAYAYIGGGVTYVLQYRTEGSSDVVSLSSRHRPGRYGSGADGSVTISSNVNIDTNIIASGRTCADAVNYSVTAFPTANSATLSSTPADGCLTGGDEVLLANLRGASTKYDNVGNYETVIIQSISTNTITFMTNKTMHYGDNSSDDTNIGTSASNQQVILQRVPNYQNLTINSGVTLTASAWNGNKGGVVFFRTSGTATINGTISTNYLGQTPGIQGNGSGYYANQNFSQSGNGYGPSSDSGTQKGGSGTNACAPISCSGSVSGGGGGGGGGHSASGSNGTNGTGGVPSVGGIGGVSYGAQTLTKLYLGAGGAGGAGGTASMCWGGNGGVGGNGGGIIAIFADTINVSVTGAVTSNGQAGSNGTASCHASDGSGGGGGGGAGGSVYVTSKSIVINGSMTALNGAGGSGGTYGRAGGNGGAGSTGRIANYYRSTIYGATTPAAYQTRY